MDEDGLPWDLSLAATQRKALRRWEIDRPYLLVASPPCTAFSVLQSLTRDKREVAEVQAELDAAIKHFAFVVTLAHTCDASWRAFGSLCAQQSVAVLAQASVSVIVSLVYMCGSSPLASSRL